MHAIVVSRLLHLITEKKRVTKTILEKRPFKAVDRVGYELFLIRHGLF